MPAASQMLGLLSAVMAQRSANAAKIQAAELLATSAAQELLSKERRHQQDIAVKKGELAVSAGQLNLEAAKFQSDRMFALLKSNNPTLRFEGAGMLIPEASVDKKTELANSGRIQMTGPTGVLMNVTVEQLAKVQDAKNKVMDRALKTSNIHLRGGNVDTAAITMATMMLKVFPDAYKGQNMTHEKMTAIFKESFKSRGQLITMKDDQGVSFQMAVTDFVKHPTLMNSIMTKAKTYGKFAGIKQALTEVVTDKNGIPKADLNTSLLSHQNFKFLAMSTLVPESVKYKLEAAKLYSSTNTFDGRVRALTILNELGVVDYKDAEAIKESAAQGFVMMEIPVAGGGTEKRMISVSDMVGEVVKQHFKSAEMLRDRDWYEVHGEALVESGIPQVLIDAGKTSRELQTQILSISKAASGQKIALINSIVGMAKTVASREELRILIGTAAEHAGVKLERKPWWTKLGIKFLEITRPEVPEKPGVVGDKLTTDEINKRIEESFK